MSTWFAEPDIQEPHTFKDIIRGLDHIEIRDPVLSGGWSPWWTSCPAGNPISSLRLSLRPHMEEDVVEGIKRAVKVVYLDNKKI